MDKKLQFGEFIVALIVGSITFWQFLRSGVLKEMSIFRIVCYLVAIPIVTFLVIGFLSWIVGKIKGHFAKIKELENQLKLSEAKFNNLPFYGFVRPSGIRIWKKDTFWLEIYLDIINLQERDIQKVETTIRYDCLVKTDKYAFGLNPFGLSFIRIEDTIDEGQYNAFKAIIENGGETRVCINILTFSGKKLIEPIASDTVPVKIQGVKQDDSR